MREERFPYPDCEEWNMEECQAHHCPRIVTDGAGVEWCEYVLWQQTSMPAWGHVEPNKSYVWLRPKKKK